MFRRLSKIIDFNFNKATFDIAYSLNSWLQSFCFLINLLFLKNGLKYAQFNVGFGSLFIARKRETK